MGRWQQGDKLTPRWQVLRCFQGGMSDVYVVHDRQLRHTLAAKTFKDELFARSTAVAKDFEREARIWIDLGRHENIATAFFVERIEGKPFIFMEYVSGGDLDGVIKTGRLASDMRQLLRLAIQICDGMSHALSHGVAAHRDLKPKNCLVADDGVLKITDFGLAMAAGATAAGTAEGHVRPRRLMGTMPYMAPEQWDNPFAVDQRADVYAFGIMLYEMITQRPPFVAVAEGKTLAQFVNAFEALHKSAPVPPFACAIPALGDIVNNCLAKAAAGRYPHFSAIRAALATIYESVTGEVAWRPATGKELDSKDWSNRGASLTALGLCEEAVAACRQAIEINGSVAGWNNLGQALIKWGEREKNLGHEAEALQLYREAVDACNEAISLDPKRAEAYDNLGLALANLGQADRALACFDTALRLDGSHVGTLGNKVNLLLRLNRINDAAAAARAAIAVDQNSADAWFSLGLVQDHHGLLAEAIDSYTRSLRLNPHRAQSWANLAADHAALGRWPDAMAAATRALGIDPDHRVALSNRAIALTALNRHADSLADLDRAVRLYPNDPMLSLNRARPLAMLGRWDEALGACDQAIALNPNYATAYIQKGAIHSERGDCRTALECYEQARRLGDRRADQRIAQLQQRAR